MPAESDFIRTPESDRVENLFHRTKRNFVVRGGAGTGKSSLLKRLVASSRKNVAVVSFTGLAALNAGGETIHRFFGLKLGFQARSRLQLTEEAEQIRTERLRKFRDLQALFIDEVSTVRADLLDAVDGILREHGPVPGTPFGGVQVGLFGDVLQLPPIVDDNAVPAFNGQWRDGGWPSPWFFDSYAYRLGNFALITLQQNFRRDAADADDDTFARLLQRLREGRSTSEDYETLNKRASPDCPSSAVALTTTNAIANQINAKQFNRLSGQVFEWRATYENWPEDWGDGPVESSVQVKVGALMMVCSNRSGPGLVNGSIGRVVRCSHDEVVLDVDGVERPVKKVPWEFPIWRWNGHEMVQQGVARFIQMPLKLAWAMTINKAQGQTIEGPVWVNLGQRVWAGGQTYVALSRVRRLKQLHLAREIRPDDVLTEERAIKFLLAPDSSTSLEEVRGKAEQIYSETSKLKHEAQAARREAVSERETTEQLVEQCRRLTERVEAAASRVEASERRINQALEEAKKGSWLRKWL